MNILPKALDDLIEALYSLPGVGRRSAERYAAHLLRSDDSKTDKLASALTKLHTSIDYCPKTFALINAGENLSPLYTDPKRDKKIIAIVEDAFDIIAIEKTSLYKGTYHVLGGLISPIDGIDPHALHIEELVKRVDDDQVEEVILAIGSSVEGESTAHYIQSQLTDKTKVTRLARGLPIGLDIEFADQITLGKAFEGRQTL